MTETLNVQERTKRRGIKEIKMIEAHIASLNEYLEICPDRDVLDRIGDSVRELRKARLGLMNRYGVDIEDLGDKQQ